MAIESWRNMLDPREAENIMEKIIEGRFQLPNGCPDEVIQFFQAAKKPEGVYPTPFIMSLAHYIEFCRNTR